MWRVLRYFLADPPTLFRAIVTATTETSKSWYNLPSRYTEEEAKADLVKHVYEHNYVLRKIYTNVHEDVPIDALVSTGDEGVYKLNEKYKDDIRVVEWLYEFGCIDWDFEIEEL